MHIIDALGKIGHQVALRTSEDKAVDVRPPMQSISPGQNSFSL